MRGLIFEAVNSAKSSILGPINRRLGKKLYEAGLKIEGQNASEDRLVPSLRRLSYSGAEPQLDEADFIAPNATILGNVNVGQNSSVWYGATLIGTKGIKIGDNCVIQDRAHLTNDVNIGNNVFVGPNVTLQGTELEDWAFVSMGSTVRHAKVQSGGVVAAGAVIGDNIVIKQGEIWAGNPGKFLRNLTVVERQILREHIDEMKQLSLIHSEETQKTSRQIISDKRQPYQSASVDDYIKDLYVRNRRDFNFTLNDEEFVERFVFMRQTMTYPDMGKDYQPYEYNISHMGQKFNLGVHNEDVKKIATKIKQKEEFTTDRDPWKQPF